MNRILRKIANSKPAMEILTWALNREIAWQFKHFDLDADEFNRATRESLPRHWFYGRIVDFIYWCGFIPF
jgi:hypothetical protein